jgi:cytochrome c
VIRGWTATISGVLTLAASVALARIHPFGDAGLFNADTANPIMERMSVPSEVRTILAAKCADCHSMETRSPAYGRLAPVSWLMERDIIRGRQAMNLSRWDRYSVEQQQTFASKIVQETKAHEMPLLQYRIIHWNSRITDTEIRTLASWAHASSSYADGAPEESSVEGDPSRGKALFEKRCTGCHALTQNHEGPRLQGVYGRTSGSVADYAYSEALKKARIVWDDKSLEKWLTDPDILVPNNNMDFLVSKSQERKDVISYLKQVSGK